MVVDKVCDYRVMFSNWWVAEWKSVPFPKKVTHPISNNRCCRWVLSNVTLLRTHFLFMNQL